MPFAISFLSHLPPARPARSLPFPPFTATQPARDLLDLREFWSAPIFATAGRTE